MSPERALFSDNLAVIPQDSGILEVVPPDARDRAEVPQVPEEEHVPVSPHWKVTGARLPYLIESASVQEAKQRAIELREARVHTTRTETEQRRVLRLMSRTITSEIPVHDPIPEIAQASQNAVLRVGQLRRDQEFSKRHALSFEEPEEATESPEFIRALDELLDTKDGEVVTAELLVLRHDISLKPREYAAFIRNWSDVQELASLATTGKSREPDASAGVENLSKVTRDNIQELGWQAWKIPQDPAELQNLVMRVQDGAGSKAITAFDPGEVLMAHFSEDNQLDSLIRMRQRTVDPEIHISLPNPEVDIELSDSKAVQEAIHVMVEKNACRGNIPLRAVRDLWRATNRIAGFTNVDEMLAGLTEVWGNVFSPFVDRLEEELVQARKHQAELEKLNAEGLVKKASRKVVSSTLGRFLPQRAQESETPSIPSEPQIMIRAQAAIDTVIEHLRQEALKTIKPAQVQEEIQCRVTREVMELVGMPSIVDVRAETVLKPLYAALTAEAEAHERLNLRDSRPIVKQLEEILPDIQDFLSEAKAMNRAKVSAVEAENARRRAAAVAESQPELLVTTKTFVYTLTNLLNQVEVLLSYSNELEQAQAQKLLTLQLSREQPRLRRTPQPGEVDPLVQRRSLLDLAVADFQEQWGPMFEAQEVDKGELEDDISFYFQEYVRSSENKHKVESVRILLEVLRTKFKKLFSVPMDIQRDLSLRVAHTSLKETAFGQNRLTERSTPAAIPVLIDALLAEGMDENFMVDLKVNASESLIEDLLNNGMPTE